MMGGHAMSPGKTLLMVFDLRLQGPEPPLCAQTVPFNQTVAQKTRAKRHLYAEIRAASRSNYV